MHRWSIYLLRDSFNCLYTGISSDVPRRFQEHCRGSGRAGRYTRTRTGLQLVYQCELGSRSLASRAEYRLKRLSKSAKEAIVAGACTSEELLQRLGLEPVE